MEIVKTIGNDSIARVYLARTLRGNLVEFAESLEPPIPINKKWVIIVSSMIGCPVKCSFCDANIKYEKKLSMEDIFSQIDYLVKQRFPDMNINVDKFKVQFARMGEPSMNKNVLLVLKMLPVVYKAPGLMPCISTVAPKNSNGFFEELLLIKNEFYHDKLFQLQFSIHTTDRILRDRLIPIKKWDFEQIAEYGNRFYKNGNRKITLNFAAISGYPIDPCELLKYFDPEKFLIKITPLNPTYNRDKNSLASYVDPANLTTTYPVIDELRAKGFEVILSIGELYENEIGSNCGQVLSSYYSS